MLPCRVLLFLLILILFSNGVHSNSKLSSSSSSKIGDGYRLISVEATSNGGLLGLLQIIKPNTIFGLDISYLHLFVKHETNERLRVHITDAENPRWEVPYNLIPREQPPPPSPANKTTKNTINIDSEYTGSNLIFSYTPDPFSFKVKRKSNGETLFNSHSSDSDPYNNLVFKDQYLEISTKLPKESSLYGLGERTEANGIKLYPRDEAYTLYATDASASNVHMDLYGSHPVYLELRNGPAATATAAAHGVLLMNSNGMDVFYRGEYLTYKVIGGVLDFYFFCGPSPIQVVRQYTSLVGKPALMPYWAFGFHQSRWGYQNVSVVEDVVYNYQKAEIPLDVIWNDDDIMDGHKDFTLNGNTYPRAKLRAFVDKIHSIGMKYIVLIDPGISVNSSYGVYERGIKKEVFIKYNGEPYLGEVWPGPVHFPDYLNPQTVEWWGDEVSRFHELVPIDGLWIDMNEPSNFCSGLCKIPKVPALTPSWFCHLDCNNITNTKWDDPPYKINASGLNVPIGFKTIAPSAVHYNGVLEYDAHSLYGFSQSIATHKALLGLEGKRPFVLCRSTFVGSGKYAAHWTGDNRGTWDDLKYSIPTMLNFGIFGVPMIGADICGFYPAPTEELCNRWIELGAFYPFSRDHANDFSPRQELYQWESVAKSARNALGMRYKLLPYLYTLNYEAHTTGSPIARPLFFSFPNLKECYNVSNQFLVGSSVLVSPVLDEGNTTITAMFPPGTWYNLFDFNQFISSKQLQYLSLPAPLNVINVHLYQNTILPMQQGGLISNQARKTPFTFVVAFPAHESQARAQGNLFLDDDDRPEINLGDGLSTYIQLYATVINGSVKVWSAVQEGKYALENGWIVEKFIVLGLDASKHVNALEINGKPVAGGSGIGIYESEQIYQVEDGSGDKRKTVMVEVNRLALPVGKNFEITWKMG